MSESKAFDPWESPFKLGRIFSESVQSRFAGDVEAAAKAAKVKGWVILGIIHGCACEHREPKLTKIIDAVVIPASRHSAFIARKGVIALRNRSLAFKKGQATQESPGKLGPLPCKSRFR